MFKEIQQLIRRPSTEKEVWVVLGGGFSISALKEQLKAPPYHVVHLVYLFQSCNANVSSVGGEIENIYVTLTFVLSSDLDSLIERTYPWTT